MFAYRPAYSIVDLRPRRAWFIALRAHRTEERGARSEDRVEYWVTRLPNYILNRLA